MRNIILFDSEARNHFLPLTATRPMGEMRLGILTLREKWEKRLQAKASYITQEYLQLKYPIHIEEDNLVINAGVLPTQGICERILEMESNEALLHNNELIAARLNQDQFGKLIGEDEVHELNGKDLQDHIELVRLERIWHLLQLNAQEQERDFELLTSGRKSQPIPPTNTVVGTGKIFLEEGAKVEACTLNASSGPIYLGRDSELMEGCMLRGGVAVCEGTVVKMGAKIYGPTTLGPHSRGGGEISRSIIFGYSNKGHDGFLGDSVLGEWCNLGADTNNSNLKNNYSDVKLWDYTSERFEASGLQFLGLIMGDHSKCGINTMFNTGTVIGVSCNLYGAGYPRNFVPDFSWGGPEGGYKTYVFNQACDTAALVMQRRNINFTEIDKAILYHVYDRTAKFRTWDK